MYYNDCTPHNVNIKAQNVLNVAVENAVEGLNLRAIEADSLLRFDYRIIPLTDMEKYRIQMTHNATWSSDKASLTKFDIISRNVEDNTSKLICSIYQPFAPTFMQKKTQLYIFNYGNNNVTSHTANINDVRFSPYIHVSNILYSVLEKQGYLEVTDKSNLIKLA